MLSLRRLLGEKREKVMWWGRDCFCCRNPQLCTNSELERYHTVLAYLIKPNVLTVKCDEGFKKTYQLDTSLINLSAPLN